MTMNRSWRIGDAEYEYVRQVLESGFPGSANVSFLAKLETAFAEKFNCKYAISHANGTATLHSALAGCGRSADDEMIVPPLTMASTSLAVLHQGAVPVFADIDPGTFLIDPESIRSRITSRTRAIITVALYGLSPDMDPIMDLARSTAWSVIEDDAQCFLGRYKGQLVGSIGDLASFSFQTPNTSPAAKAAWSPRTTRITPIELHDSPAWDTASSARGAGKSKIDKRAILHPSFKRHVSLGYNYRMSELCAAVTFAQLEHLDEFVAWRRRTAAAFDQVVRNCSWLKAQYVADDYEHSYWAYAVKLDTGVNDVTWQQFSDKFAETGR